MTNYFSSDLTFTELTSLTLQQLKESVAGSEAVSIDLVEDTINTVYFEVFTDPSMKQSAREADISFAVAPDTTLNGAVAVSATSVILTDATNFPSSGRAFLQDDIISYTGKSSNTLTGVTGVNVAHDSGENVRAMYLLTTLASDIDVEQIQALYVNGITQTPIGYENLLSNLNYFPNSYAIYDGYLIFSRSSVSTGGSSSKALMTYTQVVTALSASGDKPTLIPNSFRIPLLVYGSAMKLAAADAYRTSWDWWTKQYEAALKRYIFLRNNRVRDRNNKVRPSVYKRLM